MAETTGGGQTSRNIWWPALLGLISFALALVTRTGVTGEPLIYDEHYHVLPAQSWLAEGTLRVLDGAYERAAIFTKMVAVSFEIMGNQDPAAARLIPSAIPGALLVTVVFLWTRVVIGSTAGWFVLVFLLLWPNGIEVSQYIRFYALQGLLFVSGALLVYGGLADRAAPRRRALMFAGAAPLFLLALKLQMLTLIGLGAIGLWVAIVLLPGWLKAYRWLWIPVIAVGSGIIALLASGLLDEAINRFWTIYRWAPWPHIDDRFFYHRDFRDNYPTFWPLFPLAALVALRAYPRVASFCLVLFTVAFVVQTFGTLKNIRYLYPAMPFFFVLWAAALQALLPKAKDFIQRTAREALSPFIPTASIGAGSTLVIAISLLFLFGANAAFERSINLVRGQPAKVLLGKTRWTWPEAREMAEPWLAKGAIVVTSEEMLAVKWLGDYDVGYNRPRFSEMQFTIAPDIPPFTDDWRSGRPLIGLFEDMSRIIACEPVGIFITNARWLDSGGALRMAEAAQATGARVTTERRRGMALLAWERGSEAPAPQPAHSCGSIPTATGLRAADRLGVR